MWQVVDYESVRIVEIKIEKGESKKKKMRREKCVI